ncbi:MAG: TRAP transporter small permease [Desulfocucumaceae bacterium]
MGFKKVADRTYEMIKNVALLLLGIMVVSGFLQVFLRYVLKAPIPWAEELIRYLFVWITLLGGAMAVRSKGHLAMNMLVTKLPPLWGAVVAIIGTIATGGVLAYFTVFGTDLAIKNVSQVSDAMGIPMSLPYMAIPVGSFLMIFFLAEIMVNVFQALKGQPGAESQGVK